MVVAELPGENTVTQDLKQSGRQRHISSPLLDPPGLKGNPSPSGFCHMQLVSHRSIYKEENST